MADWKSLSSVELLLADCTGVGGCVASFCAGKGATKLAPAVRGAMIVVWDLPTSVTMELESAQLSIIFRPQVSKLSRYMIILSKKAPIYSEIERSTDSIIRALGPRILLSGGLNTNAHLSDTAIRFRSLYTDTHRGSEKSLPFFW